MKKLLSLLVCLSIMLSCVTVGIGAATAYAAEYEPSPEGDFIAFDGMIEDYIGPGGEVVIPAEIDGEAITEIASEAFAKNTDITSVVIPEGVEKIGHQAFNECSNLASVELPYSLYEMGAEVFRSCALTEITIPGGLSKVPYNCFGNMEGLSEIKISNGVKEIHSNAFGLSSPKRVIFPESVELIAAYAFCYNFTQGKIEMIICNPNLDLGRTIKSGLWEAMMKGQWSDKIDYVWNSSADPAQAYYVVVPEGSKIAEFVKNWETNGLLTPGTEAVRRNSYLVQEKDEDYFKDIAEEVEEWSIEGPRKDLQFGKTTSEDGEDGGEDGGDENEKDDNKTGSSGSNKNNKNDKDSNSTTTIVEEGGDNSMLWIILAVVGGVFLLLIIGVVVFAVIFLKKPKKAAAAPTADELRAQLAALEETEVATEAVAEEAPVEETPTEDAE